MAIIVACALLAIVVIFVNVLVLSDLCFYAAEAKDLNPKEMTHLTLEEAEDFGSVMGITKDDYLTSPVTVHFKEHFRCHNLEKPEGFGEYFKLYVASFKALFRSLTY